jgi:hypothetical protein
MELTGFTIDVFGKIMVAYAALMINRKISQEHKLDKKVLATINKERNVALLGIIFIVVGYILQVPFKI